MNVPEVRFLNIEYFFFKIYDFFGSIFRTGNQSDTSLFGSSSFSGITFSEWVGNLFSKTLSIVWVILGIIIIVLLGLMVYAYTRERESDRKTKEKYNHHFIAPDPVAIEQKNARWERIVQMFESTHENDWRTAIIEADIILDELLQSYNFTGDNLGDRLKNANPRVFPMVQSAWEAHKIRNKIAHEGMNFTLSEHEARSARRHFEFVFRNAGVI